MATKNDITGDSLISKVNSETYRNNYDLIFGKGKKNEQRTGRNDEQLENGSGSGAGMEDETASAHDRLPSNSDH